MVMLLPMALQLRFGAMTATSPLGSIACLAANRPGEDIPSSLVINIFKRLLPMCRSLKGGGYVPPPAPGPGHSSDLPPDDLPLFFFSFFPEASRPDLSRRRERLP